MTGGGRKDNGREDKTGDTDVTQAGGRIGSRRHDGGEKLRRG